MLQSKGFDCHFVKMRRKIWNVGFMMLLLLFSTRLMETNAIFGWSRSKRSSFMKDGTASNEEVLGSTRRTRSSSTGRGKSQFNFDSFFSSKYQGTQTDRCWQLAFMGLQKSCRDLLKDEIQKSKLALRLTNCFLKISRRGAINCAEGTPIPACMKKLDEHTHSIFLAFYVDASAMCHYLQSKAFKRETEELVNDLKQSAETTVGALDTIDNEMNAQYGIIIDQANNLLEIQHQMQKDYALLQAKIEHGMEGIVKATKESLDQMSMMTKYQREIPRAQQELAKTLAGEVYDAKLKVSTIKGSLIDLHEIINDFIKKGKLGHKEAMEELNKLQGMQVNILDEAKQAINRLGDEAEQRAKQFRDWLIVLEEMQQRLLAGSANIIKVQKSFAEKQAEVMGTIEKLVYLHNSILTHSRIAKSTLLYLAVSLGIFLVTAAKKTRNARLFLYFGMFLTMTFEMWLVHFRTNINYSSATNYDHLTWPPRKIILLRSFAFCLGVAYLLVTMFRFTDYDELNHKLLKTIHEKLAKRTRFHNKVVEYEVEKEEDYETPRCHRSRRSKVVDKSKSSGTSRATTKKKGSRYQEAQGHIEEQGEASTSGAALGEQDHGQYKEEYAYEYLENDHKNQGIKDGEDKEQYNEEYAYERLEDDDENHGVRDGEDNFCVSESCGRRKQGRSRSTCTDWRLEREFSPRGAKRRSSRRKYTRSRCPC